MELAFLGKNSFKFKTKNLTLVVDPVSPKERADVVVFTGVAGVVAVAGAVNRTEVFVIDKEGEYELGGVGIIVDRLSPDKEDKLVRITADGVTAADVAGLTGELEEKTLEKLRESEVLIVPLSKAGLIEEAEPYLVVLAGYDTAAEVDQFLATHKFEVIKRDIDKLKLDADSLPDNTEVVVLNG
ncbi:MAG: MBL fold metallo-hydrolase [Patescibacteria group bacterium]